MDNQKNIQDELNSLNSDLSAGDNQMPYAIPAGYFDGLAAQILAKAKGQMESVADELQLLSPFLAGVPKVTPYTLPDNYFDNLNATLPFLVREQESAVLAAIGKHLPYVVPEGYFEQLPRQLLERLPRPKAKVVPFFSRTWMKAAVAAMIGGVMFLGGYLLLQNSDDGLRSGTAQQPADTTTNLIARNQPASVTQDIQTISTSELDEFMNALPLNPAKEQKTSFETEDKNEVDKLLVGVSATEMEAFLEQLPTADETLMIID